MFPSTAAPASPLPSLRAALRQAAELTVAFATLESYTLDDVLPTGSRGVTREALAAVPRCFEDSPLEAFGRERRPPALRLVPDDAPTPGTSFVDWLAEVREQAAPRSAQRAARDEPDPGASPARQADAPRPRTPQPAVALAGAREAHEDRSGAGTALALVSCSDRSSGAAAGAEGTAGRLRSGSPARRPRRSTQVAHAQLCLLAGDDHAA